MITALIIGVCSTLFAQENTFNGRSLEMEFRKKEIELQNSEMISNIIQVINTGDEERQFYIDVSFPGSWKGFHNPEKLYTIQPEDTLYVPVRMIPLRMKEGAMKYFINAFMLDEEGDEIAFTNFFANVRRVSKWSITANPSDRIYFKNGEEDAEFSIQLANEGNDNQEFLYSIFNERKDVLLKDTTGNIVKTTSHGFDLPVDGDTTFNYLVHHTHSVRNFRRIDYENHKPSTGEEEKTFYIYANAKDPDNKQASSLFHRQGKRIGFHRLANRKKVNPYGNTRLPLIVDANVNNLLMGEAIPITNVFARGQTMLDNEAQLVYFSQIDFTTNFFNENIYTRPIFFLGYYDRDFDVQIGDQAINFMGGFPMYGRGVQGGYRINAQNRTGAFGLTSRPIVERPTTNSFGLTHEYVHSEDLQFRGILARHENRFRQLDSDMIGAYSNFKVGDKHHFSAFGSASQLTDYNDPNNVQQNVGYFGRFSYGSHYFNKKLKTRASFRHNNRYYGPFNQERWMGVVNLSYMFDDGTSLRLQSLYNRIERFNTPLFNLQSVSTNQLFYAIPTRIGLIQPIAFYNINNLFNNVIHYRGLGFMYNQFNYEKNLRLSANIRAGYNRAMNVPDLGEYFSAQFFSLVQWRVFSFNVRYFYGPFNNIDQIFLSERFRNPQILFMSFRQQHMFKGERFLFQHAINYSRHSHLDNHNVGYFPELYYYSLNGWRFKAGVGYTYAYKNNREYLRDFYDIQRADGDYSATMFQGFMFNVGIRKEFGIPIPNSDKNYHDLEFISFLDVNGNGVYDTGEELMENVVVSFTDVERYMKNEVITNPEGEAVLQNLPGGMYETKIIALSPINGWYQRFPNKFECIQSETVYIPFVRGTKLHGSIFVNRDKTSIDADRELDLSRIRISAYNVENDEHFETLTDGKGNYELYLPNGTYRLSMNEGVLGKKYRLVQNDFEIEMEEGSEGLYIPFHIVERKRKVRKKVFGDEGDKPTRIQSGGRAEERDGRDQPPLIAPEEDQPIERVEPEEDGSDSDAGDEDGSDLFEPMEEDDYDYADMSAYEELGEMIDALLVQVGAGEEELNESDIEEVPDATYYSIQVGAYAQGEAPDSELAKFKVLGDVRSKAGTDGITRYLFKRFDTAEEAREESAKLNAQGLDTFVVGVREGSVTQVSEMDE